MSKQVYNTWLSYYPLLVKDLDTAYGGPDYNNKKQIKGRKALYSVLEHLALYKTSTCDEIAKAELGKHARTKVKIKSVTDDIRKFINNNLIPRRIISEDGFKKVYNKRVQAYRLTPFGILYSIHLFLREDDNTIIINLAREYQSTLPKVFRNFAFFEKIFGDEFISILGLDKIAKSGEIDDGVDEVSILTEFVHSSSGGWLGSPFLWIGRWTDQISLMIFTSIMSHLYWKAIFEHEKTGRDTDEIVRTLISNFWLKMGEEDPEIKKWYFEFVNEAITAYKKWSDTIAKAKKWFN